MGRDFFWGFTNSQHRHMQENVGHRWVCVIVGGEEERFGQIGSGSGCSGVGRPPLGLDRTQRIVGDEKSSPAPRR